MCLNSSLEREPGSEAENSGVEDAEVLSVVGGSDACLLLQGVRGVGDVEGVNAQGHSRCVSDLEELLQPEVENPEGRQPLVSELSAAVRASVDAGDSDSRPVHADIRELDIAFARHDNGAEIDAIRKLHETE